MSEAYYKRSVKPINQCSFMGLEKLIKYEKYYSHTVYLYTDNFNQTRIVLKHGNGEIVSAIVFDCYDVVKIRYTIPEARGHKYTKQLFTLACTMLNKSFRHSQHLSTAGKASL